MIEVSEIELSEVIQNDNDLFEALNGFFMALAEDNKANEEKFLAVLRKASKDAHYVLSGQEAEDEAREKWEHDEYVRGVIYDGGL